MALEKIETYDVIPESKDAGTKEEAKVDVSGQRQWWLSCDFSHVASNQDVCSYDFQNIMWERNRIEFGSYKDAAQVRLI